MAPLAVGAAARHSAPPVRIAVPAEKTLLTVAVLTLSRELRLSTADVGRIVVKYHPGRRHLVLTPLQWTVLRAFEEGRTAPAALKHLIHERGCIPLRDYYELILQALDCGVLHTPGHPLPPVAPPAAWNFRLPPQVVRPLSVGLIATALVLVLANPLRAPSHFLWWLPGWALLALAASASAALAASVLRGADADVYRPRFLRRAAFPRLQIDLGDAVLGGRQGQIDLALAQLVPFAALAAFASVCLPSLALPLFCGLLWCLSPLRSTPATRLLRALHSGPRLSVTRRFRFSANQNLLHHLRHRLEGGEVRFALVRAGYGVAWALLVAFTWAATTRFDLVALRDFASRHDAPLIGLWTIAVLLALALAAAATLAAVVGLQTLRARREAERERLSREQTELTRPAPDAAGIARFLAEIHPFHALPAHRRQAIAEAMTLDTISAGQVVMPVGDVRRRLRLLHSGAVELVSADKLRAPRRLTPGCVFGETPLLDGAPQGIEVRCVHPGVVLVLEREAYERLVAPWIPRHKLEDAAQKIGFLRQIGLARSWPPQLLDGFARRAVVHVFDYNTVVLHQGQENLWFHVLQEGELHVVRDGRKTGRLLAGDHFGEISLLQNSVTVAEVVSHGPGRYLAIPKQDFLLFLTQDPGLAMQFEAVASRRLGRPIFPL